LKIPPTTNREIRMGSLEEIQGCIERGLELLNSLEITFEQSETRSSTNIKFKHDRVGEIGEVKVSRIGENTEIYYHPPTEPNAEETKEFLLNNVYHGDLEESLRSLLSLYREEKRLGVSNLKSVELLALGRQADAPRIDPAIYGLDNLEKVHAANKALEAWRQKIRKRRNDEFSLVRSAIVGQLNQEKILAVVEEEKPKKRQFKTKIVRLQTKPAGRGVDPWNEHAWNIIVDGKGTEQAWMDAYVSWCREKGIKKGQVDRYDNKAFKAAMSRAKKRWGWKHVNTKSST